MKYCYDLMSQPSRAIYIFLKKNKIDFKACPIALRKGEHLSQEYAKTNAFHRVPAIDDDGFTLSESVAISRYLIANHSDKVNKFWFPEDPKVRARVNEYLDWQQWNTRPNCAMYFQHKMIIPMITGKPVNEKEVSKYKKLMEGTLDKFETIWLKERDYLAADHLTLADLFAVCELQQPGIVGFDIFENRPKLTAWFRKVKDQLNPELEEASAIVERVTDLYAKANNLPPAKL